MEVMGWLITYKVIKGVLHVVIDVMDEPDKRKSKQYPVKSGVVSEKELSEWGQTAVALKVIGNIVEEIFPT